MSDVVVLPSPGEPLDPEEVLAADLTKNPPGNWPKLPAKSAAMVQHRAASIVAGTVVTWAASKAAAGMHRATRIMPEVRAYVDAMARFAGNGPTSGADLRKMTLSRLARTVQHGDDRESSVAAKVLQGMLPRPAPEPAQDLANKGDTALMAELASILLELDDAGLAGSLRLSLADSATYEDVPFPGGGNQTVQKEGTARDPEAVAGLPSA